MTSQQHKKSSLAALTLAAVGIVYGDIGTSPLYTLKTIFDPTHGLALNHDNVIVHKPQEFPQYHEGYYAAFVQDPDGFMVEVVCHRDKT